jgi:hypothetical protein
MGLPDSSHIIWNLPNKIVLIVAAALLALPGEGLASQSVAMRRSDAHLVRSAPGAPTPGGRRDSNDGRSPQGHRRFQQRRPAQVIVIPYPAYYYSPYYFAVRPEAAYAPFLCFEHGVGFISRVGMIDHLGGTHKFALQHAVAICPDEVDTCIIEGVWPPY